MSAMTYVMLSRVNSLSQIFILSKFDDSKMYPSNAALNELLRLENISINKENILKDKTQDNETLIVRSLMIS